MMLRAMWEALQAHAEAHLGEPFDHERHVAGSSRASRMQPGMWYS